MKIWNFPQKTRIGLVNFHIQLLDWYLVIVTKCMSHSLFPNSKEMPYLVLLTCFTHFDIHAASPIESTHDKRTGSLPLHSYNWLGAECFDLNHNKGEKPAKLVLEMKNLRKVKTGKLCDTKWILICFGQFIAFLCSILWMEMFQKRINVVKKMRWVEIGLW